MGDGDPQGHTPHLRASTNTHLVHPVTAARLGVDTLHRGRAQPVGCFGLWGTHALTPRGNGGRIVGQRGIPVSRLILRFGDRRQDTYPASLCRLNRSQGDETAIHQPVFRQLATAVIDLTEHRLGLGFVTACVDHLHTRDHQTGGIYGKLPVVRWAKPAVCHLHHACLWVGAGHARFCAFSSRFGCSHGRQFGQRCRTPTSPIAQPSPIPGTPSAQAATSPANTPAQKSRLRDWLAAGAMPDRQ